MKKIFVALISIILLCSVCTCVYADEVANGTCGDNLIWMLDSDGVLTISGTGNMKDWRTQGQTPWYQYRESVKSVVIEEGVSRIGSWAFERCRNAVSITIPESVKSIGEYAFGGCESLTNITIPEGVTSIEDMTFYYCKNLTEIIIPDSVTSICDDAFNECYGLKRVILGKQVNSIGTRAFCFCSNLEGITLHENVTNIGSNAFNACDSLKSVIIPESVIVIGTNPFQHCANLEKIQVDENNPEYTADEQGILYNKDSTNLICAPTRISGSFVIPDSVTNIGDSAFYGCTGLTDIIIPEGVTNIEDSAFYGCTGLKNIVIPQGVDTIGDHAFSGCESLANITIPEGVSDIGNYTFYQCGSLTNATIFAGITYIGDRVFQDCISLTGVSIPEGVISVGAYAFYGCNSMTYVTIPKGIMSIGDAAFSCCDSLEDVYYAGDEDSWGGIEISSGNGRLSSTTVMQHFNSPEGGHTKMEVMSVEANCYSPAKYKIVCNDCGAEGKEYTKDSVYKHTEVIDEAVEATCMTDGKTEGKHCSICKTVIVAQSDVPAFGHTEVTDNAVAATCTTTGKTAGKHCSACNEVLVEQTVIEAFGHSFELSNYIDPTITLSFDKNIYHKGDIATAEIFVSNANYTSVGFALYYGDNVFVVDENGKLSDDINSVVQYETLYGEEIYDVLTHELTKRTIKSLIAVRIIAPTQPPIYVDQNNNVLKYVSVGSEGHRIATVKFKMLSNGMPDVRFTTIDGDVDFSSNEVVLAYRAQTISNVKTRTLSCEWTEMQSASCDYAGEEAVVCTRCTAYNTREIPAIGHSFGEWITDKEASYYEMGEEHRVCVRCSETEIRETTFVESIKVPSVTLTQNIDGYLSGHWDNEKQEYIEGSWFCYSPYPEEITVKYKNGTIRTYSEDEIYSQTGNSISLSSIQSYENQWIIGKYQATATYMGVSADFEVVIVGNPVEKIEFLKAPNKSTFFVGEYIDLQGAVLRVTYDDGNYEDIELKWPTIYSNNVTGYLNKRFGRSLELYMSDDYSWDEYFLDAGKHKVKLIYADTTFEYDVEVIESGAESISIVSDGIDLDIIVYNENGSSFTMKALDFDCQGRGPNADGGTGYGGYLITDKGCFSANFCNCVDETLHVELFLGDQGQCINSNKINNCEWLKWKDVWHRSVFLIYHESDKSFEGFITPENIEELIDIAIGYNNDLHYEGYGGKKISYEMIGGLRVYQEEDIRYCSDLAYGLYDIDLSLYNRYNVTKGTVSMSDQGYGGGSYKLPFTMTDYGDLTQITADVWDNEQVRFWIDENYKIKKYCVYDIDHECELKDTYTPQTCTESGFTTHTCEICLNSYTDAYISPTGHKWDSGIKDENNQTSIVYTCQMCQATKSETVSLGIVDKISALISQILTYSDEVTVNALIEEYNALSDVEKTFVSNYDDLRNMACIFEHYHKGDVNIDGTIDVVDLSVLLSVYGSDNEVSDINDDKLVNTDDLSLLLSWYGTERTKY